MPDIITIRNWWSHLTPAWKGLLQQASEIAGSPNDNMLLRIIRLKSLFMHVPSDDPSDELPEMFEIRDLLPLKMLTQLEGLTIQGMVDHINSLEPVKACPRLKTLFINGTAIHDLTPLKALTQLDYLTINNTNISDLSPLAGMQALKRFMAIDSRIQSLAPLTNMSGLEMLDVRSEYLPDLDIAEFKRRNPHVRFNFMLDQMALTQEMNEMQEVSDELLSEMEEMRDFLHYQLENHILPQAGIRDIENKEFMLEVDEINYLVNFECQYGVVRLNHISCPHWVFELT